MSKLESGAVSFETYTVPNCTSGIYDEDVYPNHRGRTFDIRGRQSRPDSLPRHPHHGRSGPDRNALVHGYRPRELIEDPLPDGRRKPTSLQKLETARQFVESIPWTVYLVDYSAQD